MDIDLDSIISRLLALRDQPFGIRSNLKTEEITTLCDLVLPLFQKEPTLLEVTPPLTVLGDIHGQFRDLLRIFDKTEKKPPEHKLLFLGDYVDRGDQGIETVCLLFAWKIKYPDKVYMLRGNHEVAAVNRMYGFHQECTQLHGNKLWAKFQDVFKWLPFAAVIQDKIFCVHGGISPDLKSLDDIRNIKRPIDIPDDSLMNDLVWSDPEPDIEMWEQSTRMTSWVWGLAPAREFMDKCEFDLICRGHQAVMNGYEFPFAPDQSVLTLFSAPNYCYEYENRGAVLHVDENLYCSFTILEPIKWKEEEEIVSGERPAPPPTEGCEGQDDIMMFQVAD